MRWLDRVRSVLRRCRDLLPWRRRKAREAASQHPNIYPMF